MSKRITLASTTYYRKMTLGQGGVTTEVEIALTEETNGYQVWEKLTKNVGEEAETTEWEPAHAMFMQANDAIEFAVDRHNHYVNHEAFQPTDDEWEKNDGSVMSFLDGR